MKVRPEAYPGSDFDYVDSHGSHPWYAVGQIDEKSLPFVGGQNSHFVDYPVHYIELVKTQTQNIHLTVAW